MTYLLDTNVVCEATAKTPASEVIDWIERHADESALSVVTIGEIRKGVHLMARGKRRNAVAAWVDDLERDFADAILPADLAVWKIWAELDARHQLKGANLPLLDALIAASALAYGLIVVTRNLRDFPPEVRTLNPWLA